MTVATDTEKRTCTMQVSVKKVERGCGRSATTTYYLLAKIGKTTIYKRSGQIRPGSVREWMKRCGLDEDAQWEATVKGGQWTVEVETD